jgi:hypothetical protein
VPCIFCGNDPVTREHVYRRAWIDWLAPEATGFTNTRATGERRAAPVGRPWSSRTLDVVARCVCADCNNGWMNDLDEAAEKMVSALATGEAKVKIAGAALPIFATWRRRQRS